MSTSECICHFSNYPFAFRFKASSPLDNTTLNVADKKTDQIPADFHIWIGATAHAILIIDQFFSHSRTILIDTLDTLQGSDREVIPVS